MLIRNMPLNVVVVFPTVCSPFFMAKHLFNYSLTSRTVLVRKYSINCMPVYTIHYHNTHDPFFRALQRERESLPRELAFSRL